MNPRTAGRRRTLRARLTATLVLLSLAVLAAGCLVTYLTVRRTLWANLDGALLSIARSEVASSTDGPGGKIHVHEYAPVLLDVSGGSLYEKYSRIEDGSGRILAQTENFAAGPPLQADPELKARALNGSPSITDLAYSGQRLRAVYYPVRDLHGHQLVAIIAIPREPVDRSLRALIGTLVVALLLGGAAAAVGADRLARRITRPLERIAAAALGVGEANLSERIPEASRDAELQDVTAVLNEMLARLEKAFEHQQQLIQSQRRFVADASHELRSPLSNLRGTVEVALRRPRTAEDYRETLETTLPEIDRLCRLVNDLLVLSRADAGGLQISLAPCDLRQVAEEAVRVHGARAEGRGITLKLQAPSAVVVPGDRDRLRQVVDNLLDNALRYAPAGSTVWIDVSSDEQYAHISVRDSGPGLSEEEQQRVFERFFRADASRSRHSGGLGLGLSIARVIADAHGGSVGLQSRPGDGATFTLRLPIRSGGAAPRGVAEQAAAFA